MDILAVGEMVPIQLQLHWKKALKVTRDALINKMLVDKLKYK